MFLSPVLTDPQARACYRAASCLLRAAQVPFTETGLADSLRYHPAFPHPESLTDLLKQWRVSYMWARLSIEQLPELDSPALVWIQSGYGDAPMPACLLRAEEGKVLLHIDGVEQYWPMDHFAGCWDGLVLLAEGDKRSGEPEFADRLATLKTKKQKAGWLAGSAVFAVFTLFASAIWSGGRLDPGALGLPTFHIIGLILTLPLLFPALQGLAKRAWFRCGEGCEKTKQTRWKSWLGDWGLAEAAAMYFAHGLLIWVVSQVSSSEPGWFVWFASVHLLALIFTIFAVGMQAFVLKTWCQRCLAIAAVVILEGGWLLARRPERVNLPDPEMLAIALAAFAGLAWAWGKYRELVAAQEAGNYDRAELAWLKSQPQAIDRLVSAGSPVESGSLPGDITAGPAGAPVRLVLLIDPLCQACSAAFFAAMDLIAAETSDVEVVIRFYSPNAGEPLLGSDISARLLAIYHMQSAESALEALLAWYEQFAELKDGTARWIEQFPADDPKALAFSRWAMTQTRWWASENGLQGVPFYLINDRLVNEPYSMLRHLEKYAQWLAQRIPA